MAVMRWLDRLLRRKPRRSVATVELSLIVGENETRHHYNTRFLNPGERCPECGTRISTGTLCPACREQENMEREHDR